MTPPSRPVVALRGEHGISLVELLVGMMLTTVVAAAIAQFFSTQQRAQLREEVGVSLDENLRMASGMLGDTVRTAGCGTPNWTLSSWITWAAGFGASPILVADGGGNPDRISVATCTPPVATIALDAAAGSTSLTLASTFADRTIPSFLNATDKRLIRISDSVPAHVVSVSGNTVVIDTDPSTAGNQGLPRAFLAGSPVTRVDVSTFALESAGNRSWLALDQHRGTTRPVAEGVVDLQVTPLAANREYRITVTARGEKVDPVSGVVPTRSLTTVVTPRN